jgi:hypothetical protein
LKRARKVVLPDSQMLRRQGYQLNNVDQYALTYAANAVGSDIQGFRLPDQSVDPTRLCDARNDYRRILERTVAIEISVSGCDVEFDDSVLHQPGGAKYEDHYLGSCFDICYLSADGESVLGATIGSLPAGTNDFRVVCYVHLWDRHLPIHTQFGDHPCPNPSEMPSRIARLAPYFAGD